MSESVSAAGWIRPEERAFLRRCMDLSEDVARSGRWRRTDFLSPREQEILQSVAGHHGLVTSLYGGAQWAERKRAVVMAEDWDLKPEDFEVDLLAVEPVRNAQLTHGSVLGAVLGTGLERRKIGDVFCADDRWLVAVTTDVAGYLVDAWTAVGRDPVRVSPMTGAVHIAPPEYHALTVTVASLRLDAVVAHVCNWSRTVAQTAVARGQVSLNHAPCDRPDTMLCSGDLVSVRGFGRVRIDEVQGESRKGRIRVQVGVLRSSSR